MASTALLTASSTKPIQQQSAPHRKRFRPESSEFGHTRLLSAAVRELPHTVGNSDTDSQHDEHDSGAVAEPSAKESFTAEAERLKELDAAIAATLRLKAAYQQVLKESVLTLTQLQAQLKLASLANQQQQPKSSTEPLGAHPRPELAPVVMQCTMPPLNALMQRHFVLPHHYQQQQQQQQPLPRTSGRPLLHEQHEHPQQQRAAPHTKAAVCNRASPIATATAAVAAAAAAPTPKAAPRYSGSEFVWGSGLQHLVTVTTDEYVRPQSSSYAVVSESADSPQLHPYLAVACPQKSNKRSWYSVDSTGSTASVR
jgi:hypothetical protein